MFSGIPFDQTAAGSPVWTTCIRHAIAHAISEEAKRFYVHHGFAESPVDPMTMMITLADVEKAVRISRDQDQ